MEGYTHSLPPTGIRGIARYDCLILTDLAKPLPLPISSGPSTELEKAHEVCFCKHCGIQRICLEKMQRRYKDIISRKVCKVLLKQRSIQALSWIDNPAQNQNLQGQRTSSASLKDTTVFLHEGCKGKELSYSGVIKFSVSICVTLSLTLWPWKVH